MAGTTREAIVAILRRWVMAMNQRDLESLVALVAPDCVVQSSTGAALSGRDGIRHLYGDWFSGFPDMVTHAEDMLVDEDRAVLIFTAAGTDRGGFMGLPATGKSFRQSGVIVLTIADGLVVRYRSVYDFTGLLIQVGILKAKPAV